MVVRAIEFRAAALLLTVVLWPVATLVRRHYHAPLVLVGPEASAHRLVRLAALATVVIVGAWGGTVVAMVSDIAYLSSTLDPWLWTLQMLTLVTFVAAAVIALWHARAVWAGARRWPAKLWSVVLAVACLVVLWTGLAFHLIRFSVDY